MKLILDIWNSLNFEMRALITGFIGVLILIAIVFGQIGACRRQAENKKIEDIKANIAVREVEANILANTKNEVETNVNKANQNLADVLGTDSNKRSGDFGTVRQRWCEDHPGDSKCR